MDRVYNFSPGPAMLPQSVLEIAADEMLNFGNTGTSVMEMSHRSKAYIGIFDETVALVRELMNVPDNFKILFLQGGATGQFAAVPMNLMGGFGSADYVDSGNFANAAIKEAGKYGNVRVVASSREDNYTHIPDLNPADFNDKADYFHITTNNTIYGTRFTKIPDAGMVPLVADASSNILSEPLDVNKFGVIYAGAQKNMGPAGATLVIVREDLLGKQLPKTPKFIDWQAQAKSDSMLNTPPTYTIYMIGLCMKWLKNLGGVQAIEKINMEKSQLLYDFLDGSKLFKPTAQKEFRSRMNVTFVTESDEMNDAFVKYAASKGLINLKGHRLVGGMRASIYNAMPREGVVALVDVMKQFEADNA